MYEVRLEVSTSLIGDAQHWSGLVFKGIDLPYLLAQASMKCDELVIESIDKGKLLVDCVQVAYHVLPSVPRTRLMSAWQEAFLFLEGLVEVLPEKAEYSQMRVRTRLELAKDIEALTDQALERGQAPRLPKKGGKTNG